MIKDIALKDIFKLLSKHKFTILLITLFIVAVGIGYDATFSLSQSNARIVLETISQAEYNTGIPSQLSCIPKALRGLDHSILTQTLVDLDHSILPQTAELNSYLDESLDSMMIEGLSQSASAGVIRVSLRTRGVSEHRSELDQAVNQVLLTLGVYRQEHFRLLTEEIQASAVNDLEYSQNELQTLKLYLSENETLEINQAAQQEVARLSLDIARQQFLITELEQFDFEQYLAYRPIPYTVTWEIAHPLPSSPLKLAILLIVGLIIGTITAIIFAFVRDFSKATSS